MASVSTEAAYGAPVGREGGADRPSAPERHRSPNAPAASWGSARPRSPWPLAKRRRCMRTKECDETYVGRDAEAYDLEVVRAEGSTLIDARGRRVIDFVMGWC